MSTIVRDALFAGLAAAAANYVLGGALRECRTCGEPVREGLIYCGGSLACWKRGEGIMGVDDDEGFHRKCCDSTDDEPHNAGCAPGEPTGVCATKGCPLTGAHLHEAPRPEARAAEALIALGVVSVETVDHPSHYGGDTPYEVIKVLEAWDPVMTIGFCWGNSIKYLARAGKKTTAAELEDLKKANWYSNKYVELKAKYAAGAK